MKIIALEGIDKSGKATQTALLVQRLRAAGYRVEQSEFHRYDTPTGKLIRQWLTGKLNVDQATIELIMAADKHAQKQWFAELEKAGIDYLVLDRYTYSQLAYGQASGTNRATLEVLLMGLPEQDAVIYIDLRPEISMARKGKHGDNDRYESDLALLERVRDHYFELLHQDKMSHIFRDDGYTRPYSTQFNGEVAVDLLHDDIWNFINQLITKGVI